MNKVSLFLALTIVIINLSCGERILVFLPISSKSVNNVFESLINGLANKGHTITTVSSVRSLHHENVTQIIPIPTEVLFGNLANPFELRKLSSLKRLKALSPNLLKFCEVIYEHPEIQMMVKNPRGRFDLLIINAASNHCFFGLIHSFNVPIVSLMTLPPANFVTEKFGVHLPYSVVPFTFLPYTDRMTFFEKIQNAGIQWMAKIVATYFFKPKCNALKNKHHGENSPTLDEIERNFSLLLTNTHPVINSKLQLTKNIVEIGGMHCRAAENIEGELQTWLDKSENGFIYFSFGSIIQSMPENYKNMFINAFANLTVNVLWKWDSYDEKALLKLPKNIRLEKWLPQQDVLGHKNAKLFISHGGLLSVFEALFHAVPILGFPFFLDQDQNLAYVQQNGVGLKFEILEMTEDKLEKIISDMLKDKSYKLNAITLSKILRDQPQTPLERGIWWIEYVMRHKGAAHLSSFPARDLNFIQYHSLDVIAFLIGSSLIVIKIVHYAVKRLFGMDRRKKDNATSLKKFN